MTISLNQLLSQQLGNYIAFAPGELSTAALSLAALETEIVGFFELEGRIWQVYQRQIAVGDFWCDRRILSLENHYRKILAHTNNNRNSQFNLGDWDAGELIKEGDRVIYLEITNDFNTQLFGDRYFKAQDAKTHNWFARLRFHFQQLSGFLTQLNFRQQIRRVALINIIIIVNLLIIGTVLFRWYYPEITTLSAFLATAILLLGGYGDLFAELEDISFIPWWIRLFSLILTLVGTVFVGVIYALLIETLLSSRFELVKQPLPIPQQDHIVIVGMSETGQKIEALLGKFRQKVVGITFDRNFYRQYASQIPLITGNLETALTKANLFQAKSIVIVTDDEILNLETALMAKAVAPQLNVVLKTSGIRISQHLKTLLPTDRIVGVYEVAAAAFTGAAFGENILNLFRWGDNTILVTEYHIEAEDTLHGLILPDVAYGYGVVPIVYQQPNRASVLLPLDQSPLNVGDRLVLLATIDGLRRIEQGLLNLTAKQWQIHLERALTPDALFDGANTLTRITGCSLTLARETMNNLPTTFPVLLYHQQAHRLIQELQKALVISSLLARS